jgi:hypothetical protein
MLEDDEIDDAPITRILVSAKDAPAPTIKAARTVFELAGAPMHIKHGAKAGGGVKFSKYRKELQDGKTINVGTRYPADRITTEKVQAEEARRAKQRPPKPTLGYKTISKKFQMLVS